MSNKRAVLRGAQVQGLERWRPGGFVAPAPEVADTPSPDPVPRAEITIAAVAPEAVAAPPEPSAAERLAAEIEALRAQAREEGFAAGRAEGMAAAAEDAQALRALAAHLRDLVEDLEQGIANDVLSLSLEVAKLIVRHALRMRPELVLGVIREAARSFPGIGAATTLVLHPDDAELLRRSALSDPEALPWQVVEDARMERGGCRLENATTEIDATLETRWRRAVAGLGRDDAWLDLNL